MVVVTLSPRFLCLRTFSSALSASGFRPVGPAGKIVTPPGQPPVRGVCQVIIRIELAIGSVVVVTAATN